MGSRPLISFYVIAYNQQHYIHEAVEAAFRQTWSPLEIILSDDCSEDDTFGIMQRMASMYRGPHRVILNRNPKNLGVSSHINRIVELCKGELIVASAGDDVSDPHRVTKLYELWLRSQRTPYLLYSNLVEIDENGSVLRYRNFASEVSDAPLQEFWQWNLARHLQGPTPPVHGAACAWRRELFDLFGPLPPDTVHEDNILSWRAEGLGCVALHPDYLVMHRNHSHQLTNMYSVPALQKAIERRRTLAWSSVVSLRQNLLDANVMIVNGYIGQELFERACSYVSSRLAEEEFQFNALHGNYWSRLATIALAPRRALAQKKLWRFLLWAVTPHPVLRTLYRLLAAVRSWRNRLDDFGNR